MVAELDGVKIDSSWLYGVMTVPPGLDELPLIKILMLERDGVDW